MSAQLHLVPPTIEPIRLRPYQDGAIEHLRGKLRAGRRRIVLVSPTGSGKTVIASAVVRSAIAKGSRVVVIAHRKELIDQTHEKLSRFGVDAGVIMADNARFDDYLPVQLCSIQTLIRRLDNLPPADLVIYDECHHSASPSSVKVLEAYREAILLGLTATPWRLDRRGLADIYDDSVLVTTPAELIASGALVNYDAFAYDAPELRDVGLVAGEYNQKDLAKACNTNVLVGSIVDQYIAHARGRRALLFPVDVEHSRHLVTKLQIKGVVAEHLDCDTPKHIREAILGGLGRGTIEVVSSVGVLTEGFDCCPAEVAILARPTKSTSLLMQMCGRVLRPSPETGKKRALFHDHGGNFLRLGFPDDPRDYSLTSTPARTRDVYECPLCDAVFAQPRPDGTCPACSEVIAPVRKPAPGGGAQEKKLVDGKRLSKEELQKMRAELIRGGAREGLTDAQVLKANRATIEEKAAEYKRLVEVAKEKGFKPGFAAHQYRAQFGRWPRIPDDVLERVPAATKPFFPLPPREPRRAGCACGSAETRFFQTPFASGDGEHISEHCQACDRNVRGAGIRVPKAELGGIDRSSLPVRPSATPEPSTQLALGVVP